MKMHAKQPSRVFYSKNAIENNKRTLESNASSAAVLSEIRGE